jgi:multidrug efflux pump subunit AcrA (membrane-fusion protein)
MTLREQRLMKTNVPGTVQIIIGSHPNAFLVERSALLHDDESNSYSLVIMLQDSLARVVGVTLGAQTDSLVEVHSDFLRPGQSVITRGQYSLKDSTRVTVEQ